MKNYPLKASDPISMILRNQGLKTWGKAVEYIHLLPYGRNKNRSDLSLVLKEKKGTCSSKHALLKHIADSNQVPDVKLILGIYAMNHLNTPKIGTVLLENNMEYIPEAHCYLKIRGEYCDYTTEHSVFDKIQKAIMLEKEIEAEQVNTYKVEFHKTFLKNWIIENNPNHNFEAIWAIREQCIKNIASSTAY